MISELFLSPPSSATITDSTNDTIYAPPPRRIECAALPIESLASAPIDYDPTLREPIFDFLNSEESAGAADSANEVSPRTRRIEYRTRLGTLLAAHDFPFNAQQRVDAYCDANPLSYGDEVAETDAGIDADFQNAKEMAEEYGDDDYDANFTPWDDVAKEELDNAPDGFDSFTEYESKVRPLIPVPFDLTTIVMEYLDFDAPHRIEQALVTTIRLLEQVALYRKNCIQVGEEWPALTAAANKEKAAADEFLEIAARFSKEEESNGQEEGGKKHPDSSDSSEESKDDVEESTEEEDDDTINEDNQRIFEKRLRDHPSFYYLSPHTRRTLVDFSAKLAPYGIELVRQNNQVEPSEHISGEISMKYLDLVQEVLSDELEAWEDLHDELEESMDTAAEEIRFAFAVEDLAKYIFSLPSSGIFQNEDEFYDVEDISQYCEFQEGEGPEDWKEKNKQCQITNITTSSSSSSEPNPRKRSRDDSGCVVSTPSIDVTSSIPSSTATVAMETESDMEDDNKSDADEGDDDDEGVLQSLTNQTYNQILDEHPELRESAIQSDRTAHLDKRLKLVSSMDSDDSSIQIMDLQSQATCAVLKDPDFFEKKKAYAARLASCQESVKASLNHESKDDEEDPYFYPPQSTVWRRRMTPAKYEAAWACLEYYDELHTLLHRPESAVAGESSSETSSERYVRAGDARDRYGFRRLDLYQHTEEIKQRTEKLRISVSHYYLLHMNRSFAEDEIVSDMNQSVQIRIEQACTDMVFNKENFAVLVYGLTPWANKEWSSGALAALQTAAEAYLIEKMDMANQRLGKIEQETKVSNILNSVSSTTPESSVSSRLRVCHFQEV